MKKYSQKHNRIEQITFFSGVFILLALLGDLTYKIAADKDKPPHLRVISQYDPSFTGYVYSIEIENTGEQTAASVTVQFGLFRLGRQVETAAVDIKHVPAKSRKTGWVSFYRTKQDSDSLKVTSVTYMKP